MKHLQATLTAAVLVTACAAPQSPVPGPAAAPAALAAPAVPSDWEPAYWNAAMREAMQARGRGDRMEAERACGRGMRYVEVQAVQALYRYAELLDKQQYGVGVTARGRAQKLEQAREVQAQTGKSGGTYLGFDPGAELATYAEYLRGTKRDGEAKAVDDLAAAYRYGQEVNFRRALLVREGKDPTGEC